MLVVNSDDPTIWGLFTELKYDGRVVTFGVDHDLKKKVKTLLVQKGN